MHSLLNSVTRFPMLTYASGNLGRRTWMSTGGNGTASMLQTVVGDVPVSQTATTAGD